MASLAALGGAITAAPVSSSRAEYGDVVLNQRCGETGIAPVVFPHWFHRIRYRCKVCHGDLGFAFKAGQDHIDMLSIIDGQYCGACHNGTVAWSSDRCELCHSGKAGLHTQVSKLATAAATPERDGFHDPGIEGTRLLQDPVEAFSSLPRANGGNYVNWSEALRGGQIAPRFDKDDPKLKPQILQLDVVRQVKGYTPPGMFPHAAHSEWLGCPECHPALFRPTKGGNTFTMNEIMAGQKCGVCHGTVAFPTAECRRCHYVPVTRTETKLSAKAKPRTVQRKTAPTKQANRVPEAAGKRPVAGDR